MYEIALTVSACLRAGTRVIVVWPVTTGGLGPVDMTEALAITPGGGRVGSLLSGALDGQLADLASQPAPGRAVDLRISDLEAQLAGLPHGGTARCLLVPATQLPADLWDHLLARDPVRLVTQLDGDLVREITLADPDGEPEDGAVATTLRPVPQLVIVGAGPMADALGKAADLLGWHIQAVTQPSTATGLIAGLAPLDKVVVMSHDDDIAGPALSAALSSRVGYIGSVGSRRVQESRADWLAYRGITDLARVRGPAGLDIGAGTPAEIAVSIVAEAIAERNRA